MMVSFKKVLLLGYLALGYGMYAKAVVKPNSLFTDNMVLQRGISVPVWGTALPDEEVTVSFNGQKEKTKAGKDGNWSIRLKPMKAGGPFEMTIAASNSVTIRNIVIGEVWLCSGQSNMERELGLRNGQKPIENWTTEAASANYPLIRQFTVPRNPSDSAVKDCNGLWTVCDTVTVKKFSAVGYFFASELFKKLNVPVGIIYTTWGGTPAENWTSRSAMQNDTALAKLVEEYEKAVVKFKTEAPLFKEQQTMLLEKWKQDSAAAASANKAVPKKPAPPRNPAGGGGGLFNGMIAPLIPFAIKGAIWYQGESNAGRSQQYRTLFPAMIKDWRDRWGIGDFPFLYVQIAPYNKMNPEIREAQLLSLQKLPNLAMATTTDVGDSTNIHPTRKRPVGERLAIAARALAYKEKIEYTGPLYQKSSMEGNKISIVFEHIGSGLMAKGDKLIGFTIAGADKKFVEADAVIVGNKVVVSNPRVENPTAVRYAWASYPLCNLFNNEGMPASPFRTDVDK